MPVLLLVTPVPLFATLATATPLHFSHAPARQGILATGNECASKVHDHAIALFNRPPSPRTQTKAREEGREPIPPRHHHAIDLAGSQFPKHRLSGCTRRHSSRHVVRHATRTIPIPNFSLQAKVMGMLECRGVSDSLATRRAALRPRHSTTQHSTATPLTIPDPESGYFLSFFLFLMQ
jgi:hypothetical protein